MHNFHRRIGTVIVAVTVFAAIATIVAAPSARAQGYGRTMAISGFAGYNIASDIYDDLNGQGSLEFKNGLTWGGRLTAFTNEFSAVEFAYSRVSSDLGVKSSVLPVPADFDPGSISLDEYDLNFLVSQPTSNPKLWPYFTLGFGWSVTHPDVRAVNPNNQQAINAESNTLFGFNFGIGTMVQMNPKMALRLDARWRVTDTHITTSSGVYCDYWGYCWGYSSDWYNSGELTAGLTYRLGQ